MTRARRQTRSRTGVLIVLATMLALLAVPGASAAAASKPSWFQLHPPNSPPVKGDTAAAYDPATRQFVMFGGISNENLFQGDTWVWTGSNWVRQFPATVPEAREGARMAYDAATKQLILFGGYDGYGEHGLSDTWTWNGSNWVQLHPATSPPPTSDEGIAYDPATKQILIFGGYQWFTNGTGETQQNMWAWNGSDWQQVTPATVPARRIGASMGWDSTTSQLILFGGEVGSTYYNDTWLWNGTNWVQKSPATIPPVRMGAPLVFDPATAQMLLIGGLNNSALGDTWTWSGTNWSQQNPANPITPARYQPAADYDTFAQQLLVFGGAQNGVSYLNDTWLWSRFVVATPSLPVATVGLSYASQVDAIEGTPPYTWSVSSGSLPPGLTLSPGGLIAGTAQTAGHYSFKLLAADSAGLTALKQFTIVVNPSPTAGVWVSNGGNSVLNAFPLTANGNASPTATLGGSLTQLNSPGGLVLDPSGKLYVSNSGTPSITVYAAGASGNAKPIRVLTGADTGLAYPDGLALDASGRLYVADSTAGTVTVYPANAQGDQPPVQTIAGPHTGLRQPVGVTLDAFGHIWVLDYANNSLLEYPQDASGDVAPIETISGSSTLLNLPDALAQDSHGRLLVSNLFGASVTEYANAPPYGNVPPDFTISGSGAQLSLPQGLDVDAANDLYVANEFGGVNVYAPNTGTPEAIISGGNTGLASPHSLAVAPPMQIATRSLPPAALGRRYAGRVIAILGVKGLRWRVVRGRLPRGLRLQLSGAIAGIPRRLGTSTVTVQVRSGTKRVPGQSRKLRLTVRRAPAVIGLRPARGRATGAMRVTITGAGFATARNATVIAFGRLRALKVRCRSATVCTVRTPAHARGAVNVTVTVRGLISARGRRNRFSYRR